MQIRQRDALIVAAQDARTRAYCPYSHFAVGAAVLTEDGRIWGGGNIENASFGLTVCAERVAVFSAVAAGAAKIAGVAVVTQDGSSPCGACRQVLSEFADGPTMPVLLCDANGTLVLETTLGELLPHSFSLKCINEHGKSDTIHRTIPV